MPNKHYENVQNNQQQIFLAKEEECTRQYGQNVAYNSTPIFNSTTNNYMCPAYWDKMFCWPNTPANTTAVFPCPEYVIGFQPHFNATRRCTENGTWFVNSENNLWADYTACFNESKTTIYADVGGQNVSEAVKAFLPTVKIISQTGYTTSLISLVVAFAIMFLIKKLHCARNILHMNLFASFILRAFFWILKDILFVDGIGTSSDVEYRNGKVYFITNAETNNYKCKILTSLVTYFTTANYSWILMEGLYLNNLIFRALFADSSKNIVPYIVFGWGLPLLVVIPWILARVFVDDTFCWTTNEVNWIYLIIVIPTIISVMINLILFVIISIVLYSKLRSPVNEESRRYLKWAKSTLVLVPLFGVHYAVLLVFYFTIQTNAVIEIIWLISDTFFATFQGFFVAVLYCFLNGEVKSELQPHIHSALTYLATNRFFRCFFPCRERYLRSVLGRQSVCTTLSCSSLYTNGIHRNSRSKWDMFSKARNLTNSDKCKDHICNNVNRRNSRSHSKCSQNGLHLLNKHCQQNNFGSAETTLSIDHKPDKCPNDSIIEEEICMLTRNF